MPADKTKSLDYQTLSSPVKGGANSRDQAALRPLEKTEKSDLFRESLINPAKKPEIPAEPPKEEKSSQPETFISDKPQTENFTFARQKQIKGEEKRAERDFKLLSGDRWLIRNGHTLTFIGLYLFSILVLFRPYELLPSLSFLSATAFYFAAATFAVYLPAQLSTEGNLTILTTEAKCILGLTLLALFTMPIAKSPAVAWETFNDPYIKAVLMFVIMINVIRSRSRLMGMIWLSLSVGVVLSYMALSMFRRGELNAEGYRVAVNVGGLFGNPNDMALHLVTMIPLAVCLGIASRSNLRRVVYFAVAALLVGGNFVTYSRGGFLGMVAAAGVLIWKLGRKHRLNVTLVSIFIGGLVILLAPGNYGTRILSIFGLAADPVGSSDQRKELLERSIIVSLRNPWGIGIGNFPIVGVNNLVSHNSFTQISSELGILGLLFYLIFMISPFRKLGAIERTQFARDEHDWFYYLSIGFQASIVGFMVSSFFVSVAYNWFIYYLIAYAVAFRRIYQIEKGLKQEVRAESFKEKFSQLKTAWQNG